MNPPMVGLTWVEYAHSVGRNVGFDKILELEERLRMMCVNVARIVHLYVVCTEKSLPSSTTVVSQYNCKCRMTNEAI